MQVLNIENEKKMDSKEFYFSLEPKFFKGLIAGISSIVNETKFVLDEKKGLRLTAMDTSHICLIAVNIDKDDLDFEIKGRIELAVCFEDFKKIIDRAKNTDTLKFKNSTKKDEVILEILPEKSGRVKTFSLTLIDFDGDEIQLDSLEEMEFSNKIEYSMLELYENIVDSKIYSEVFEINIYHSKVEFSASGNIGSYNYVIEKGQLYSFDFSQETNGIFAIAYLENILKIGNILGTKQSSAFKNAKFIIETKSDAPLKITLNLLENSKIIYFLAPRVTEDDDDDYMDKKNPEIEMKMITFIENEIRIAENEKGTIMNEIRIIEDQKVKDQKKAFEESENGNMEIAISLLNDVRKCNEDITEKKEMISDINNSIIMLEKNL